MKEEGRRFFLVLSSDKQINFILLYIIVLKTHTRSKVVDKKAIERYGEMARRV